MDNVMKVQVLGGKRYDMESGRFAAIYIAQPSNPDRKDTVGLEVMKVGCPYDLLDTFKGSELPGEFEVAFNLKMGGGGKAQMEAVAVRSSKGHGPASSPVTTPAK